MNNFIYRDGKLFKIDQKQLPESAKTIEVINSLYTALYVEFAGAVYNDKYKNMTNQQKMEQINIFAVNWLKQRKYL